MKKIKLHFGTAIILLASLGLSACGSGDGIKDDPDLKILTGVLEEQSGTDDLKGTHILIDDVGKITAVRSLAFNLSSNEYLEKELQLVGFLNEDDDVFEITGISVIGDTDEDDPEGEFTLYLNTDLGFEIEYIDTWVIEDSIDKITFTGEGAQVEITQFPFSFSVSETETDTSLPLLAFMNQYYPQAENPESLLNKLGDDGLDAIKYDDGDDVDYFLYRNGLIYQLAFLPSDEESLADNLQIFNEMARSFRFVGFTVDDSVNGETSEVDLSDLPAVDVDFTSFESLPYHFKADYPAKWYYAGRSGGASDVRHHYGFNEEAIEDGNELITLDVLAGGIPAGESISIGGLQGTRVSEGGGNVSIYTTVDGQNFRIRGSQDFESIMLIMAASITPIEVEEDEN